MEKCENHIQMLETVERWFYIKNMVYKWTSHEKKNYMTHSIMVNTITKLELFQGVGTDLDILLVSELYLLIILVLLIIVF